MRIRTLSVTEVNRYIGRIVENDPILSALNVRGEVSNFKVYASGHAYFNLKDEGGKLPCVMFKASYSQLNFTPQEGQSVIARGHMAVYDRDGRYQLMIHHLEPEGEGALYLAFLKLKETLQAKGYFDLAAKKPLPLIKRIGLVTSVDGAAVRDFLSVLKRLNPMVEVVIYPSRVQGIEAIDELITGITYFNKTRTVDAIVLTRGGGSIEELWAFNEEKVAQAIFNSDLPIISAVGHETDTTIADFVSDLRAPTPSAAAELISKPLERYKEDVYLAVEKAKRALGHHVERSHLAVARYSPMNNLRRLESMIAGHHQYLDHLYQTQAKAIFYRIDEAKHGIEHMKKTLTMSHPDRILKRGFAMVKDEEGHVLQHIDHIKLKKTYTLVMADGDTKIQKKELCDGTTGKI